MQTIEQQLRAVLGHLVDHGKIELGTPQSAELIDACRRVADLEGAGAPLTGPLRFEAHIPRGSGDAEWRVLSADGAVIALVDPECLMPDAAFVAEKICRALSGLTVIPPEVGSDPHFDEVPALPFTIRRLRAAYVTQQPLAPDQLALVWRTDLSRLMGDYIFKCAGRDAFLERMTALEASAAAHDRRVTELLEANNAYLERARIAERLRREAVNTVSRLERALTGLIEAGRIVWAQDDAPLLHGLIEEARGWIEEAEGR